MSYLKLIIVSLFGVITISCGTDSDPKKWRATWEKTGLHDQYITALDYSDSYLLVAGKEQLFRKGFSTDTEEWLELDIEINPENSEFGDVLFTNQGAFAVVRNTTDYHELPENYVSLYKSENAGQSWEPLQINLEGRDKPYVINRMANGERADGSIYADWHLIFKSVDGGTDWTNLTKDENVGVSEFLYVSKDHPNQIWTGGWTNIFSPYLAKSEDGGETWANLSENISFNVDATVYSAVIHPKKKQKVLAGVGGLIRKSENGGSTWKTVLEGYNIRVLKNSLMYAGKVYSSGLSAHGQLFVAISNDFGDSWEIEIYEESPSNIQTNDMIITQVDGNETLFLGTNKGVYSLTLSQ